MVVGDRCQALQWQRPAPVPVAWRIRSKHRRARFRREAGQRPAELPHTEVTALLLDALDERMRSAKSF
jgi:hypothetical protein